MSEVIRMRQIYMTCKNLGQMHRSMGIDKETIDVCKPVGNRVTCEGIQDKCVFPLFYNGTKIRVYEDNKRGVLIQFPVKRQGQE